jgi:hypothetical protein
MNSEITTCPAGWMTGTVSVAAADPLGFVAVSVKVEVVASGVVNEVTAETSAPLRVSDAADVVDHASVTDWPGRAAGGEAVKEEMTGGRRMPVKASA